jgi:hypothetical protein
MYLTEQEKHTVSVKGEKYASKKGMKMHEKKESPSMRMKEYGKKAAVKKMGKKK